MALHKNNENYTQGNLIILRIVTRDENKHDINAAFQVTRKNDEGNWVKDKDTFSSITGDIFRLETYSSEWEGNISWGYKVFIKDDDVKEAYILDNKFNMLTRDLANKVLGLTELKNVTISVYKNKKGYNTSALKIGENLVRWKYGLDELPESVAILHPRLIDEKTGKNKVLSRDYSDVDAWFVKKLNEFAKINNLLASKDKTNVIIKDAKRNTSVEEDDGEMGDDVF